MQDDLTMDNELTDRLGNQRRNKADRSSKLNKDLDQVEMYGHSDIDYNSVISNIAQIG